VWQAIRQELYPEGLEIVTVALDSLGLKVALPFIEVAKPTHPSLIDEAHLLDELFGVVNVPSGVWIDEEGVIVRPPEPAFPTGGKERKYQISEDTPLYVQEMITEVKKIQRDPAKYMSALRDWVTNGANSRYALSPDAVIERSQPRPVEEAQAAAHFELGQYLYQQGQIELAIEHFKQSHRLQPNNWTYRRQAWSMVDPLQGPSSWYDSDWLSDVRKIGAENYYPTLKME